MKSLKSNFWLFLRMCFSWAWCRLTFAKTVSIQGTTLLLNHPALSPKMRFNLRLGHYEAHEHVLLSAVLSPDDRLLEVGGGVGFLSLVASQMLPPSNILTVEANPQLVELIQANQKLNDVEFGVLNAVLGTGETMRDFYVTPNFWASSLAPAPGAQKISVPQRDFQTLLDDYKPTVLVVDIEGGEAELLSTPDLKDVRLLLLELHPQSVGPDAMSTLFLNLLHQGLMIDLLTSCGYVYIFRRTANKHLPE